MKQILAILSILLVGCATVREHEDLKQPANKLLTASVGSTVFRVNKSGDLPNAFGGRDIYGGKIDLGYSEVKLIKIEEKRFVYLLATEIHKQSAETTMDRYKTGSNTEVNQSVIIGGTSNGSVPVMIDTQEENIYVLGGIRVEIVAVRGSSIDYLLTQQSH